MAETPFPADRGNARIGESATGAPSRCGVFLPRAGFGCCVADRVAVQNCQTVFFKLAGLWCGLNHIDIIDSPASRVQQRPGCRSDPYVPNHLYNPQAGAFRCVSRGDSVAIIPDSGFRKDCESGENSVTKSIGNELTVTEGGRNGFSNDQGSTVPATQSKVAIPVAWTFMSEILASHRRIVERLSRHNNQRSDSDSWPYDGHECPSYV